MIYNTKVTSKGQVTIPVEIMVNSSMDAFREAQRAFAGEKVCKEVKLRLGVNVWLHICKVSAKGSHRREPIYRKTITGSKRYILILLTACNGFLSGKIRK